MIEIPDLDEINESNPSTFTQSYALHTDGALEGHQEQREYYQEYAQDPDNYQHQDEIDFEARLAEYQSPSKNHQRSGSYTSPFQEPLASDQEFDIRAPNIYESYIMSSVSCLSKKVPRKTR